VLKAISRAAYNLDSVLNTLIVTAARLCGANHGQIWRRDGEVFRYAASHMNVPAYRGIEEHTAIKVGRGTLIGRVGMERRPVLITDAWNYPEYEDQEGARLAEARSMLGVPLLRDGELIGPFALARRLAVPFTDQQVKLVRTFADQGGDRDRKHTDANRTARDAGLEADPERPKNDSLSHFKRLRSAVLRRCLAKLQYTERLRDFSGCDSRVFAKTPRSTPWPGLKSREGSISAIICAMQATPPTMSGG
jgi:transcriptional regulator with GAF, ATPase, and Fis domain